MTRVGILGLQPFLAETLSLLVLQYPTFKLSGQSESLTFYVRGFLGKYVLYGGVGPTAQDVNSLPRGCASLQMKDPYLEVHGQL